MVLADDSACHIFDTINTIETLSRHDELAVTQSTGKMTTELNGHFSRPGSISGRLNPCIQGLLIGDDRMTAVTFRPSKKTLTFVLHIL